MTSFGQQRRVVESFGRSVPQGVEAEADVPQPAPPPSSAGTIYVDIKINPVSLERLREQLAAAVCDAVETGFARAGTMDHPEQT